MVHVLFVLLVISRLAVCIKWKQDLEHLAGSLHNAAPHAAEYLHSEGHGSPKEFLKDLKANLKVLKEGFLEPLKGKPGGQYEGDFDTLKLSSFKKVPPVVPLPQIEIHEPVVVPMHCPIDYVVNYQAVVLPDTEFNTVERPVPFRRVEIVTLTATTYATVTQWVAATHAIEPHVVQMTDYHVVWTPVTVQHTSVFPITRGLVETYLDFLTSTATTYLTTYEAVTSTRTMFHFVREQLHTVPVSTYYEVIEAPGVRIPGTFTSTINVRPTETVYHTTVIGSCPLPFDEGVDTFDKKFEMFEKKFEKVFDKF